MQLKDDTIVRNERTVKLQASQAQWLPWLLIVGASLLVIALAIIALSKWGFGYQGGDYLSLVFFDLSLFDVTSDVFFLRSLYQTTSSDIGAEFRVIFFVGTISLGLVMVANVIMSRKVVVAEKARSVEFRRFCSDHRLALALCQIFAAFKPNVVELLASRLFQSRTRVFSAPLSADSLLRIEMRVLYYLTFFGEDVLQIIIVLVLQTALLGGWTTMNIISFSTSCGVLLAGVSANTVRLHKDRKRALHATLDNFHVSKTDADCDVCLLLKLNEPKPLR